MNQAVMDFVKGHLPAEAVANKTVLEVGSYNVNGSVAEDLKTKNPSLYIGIDITEGPGVDRVVSVHDLESTFGSAFDVVVSTEMLEHVEDWKSAVHNMKAVCNVGGRLIVTARSIGMWFHGYPHDYWRFSVEDFRLIFSDFIIESCIPDPSGVGVFVSAVRPEEWNEIDLSNFSVYSMQQEMTSSVLEQDVVMGTFTHRTKYLDGLLNSVRDYEPSIPFITQIANLPISGNFNELHRKFKESGKRYWLFLDDDIEFISQGTVAAALTTMINGKYAAVGCYSTYDPNFQSAEMTEREVTWIPGYFQLVDSHYVGDIVADVNLPCPNTSIDTSYCVDIRRKGYKIGLAPVCVYHTYKTDSWADMSKIPVINDFLFKKYGQFYFDSIRDERVIVGDIPNCNYNLKSKEIYIDRAKLVRNRTKLLTWQQQRREEAAATPAVRLHLGCGELKWAGYVNMDIDGTPDVVASLETLDYADNSVDEIVCQHALEHVPVRVALKALTEWARVLKSGGEVEIGVPDMELLAADFLLSDENTKWNWLQYAIYGQQGPMNVPASSLTYEDIVEGQFHRSAYSTKRLTDLLASVGIEVIETYQYDGWGTPSVFVLGRKI